MKMCGSKAGIETELPGSNSIGRLQRYSKHAKAGANGTRLLALCVSSPSITSPTRQARRSSGFTGGLDVPRNRATRSTPPLSKRLSDPSPAHFEHAAAADICGDRGAQQQKCDAKSENQWHLPHVRLSLDDVINRQRCQSSCRWDYCLGAVR